MYSSYFLFFIIAVFLKLLPLALAQPCPLGTFLSQSKCELCPAGTYSNTTGATTCTPCKPGTASNVTGAQGPECPFCQPGTFAPTPASLECKPCPNGTSSSYGKSECIACPIGSAIALYPSNAQCQPCSGGSYQDEPGQFECKSCSNSQISISPNGATSIEQCQICPPGMQGGSDECFGCGAGNFRPEGSPFCESCPLGTFNNDEISATCKPCPVGQYGLLNGPANYFSPECRQCPEGFTTYSEGRVLCRKIGAPCPTDHLETPQGDCVRCEMDEYYSQESFRCLPCPRGTGSVGGLVLQCNTCRDVVNADVQHSRCYSNVSSTPIPADATGKCRKGSYKDKETGICLKCQTSTPNDNGDECPRCGPNALLFDFGSNLQCLTCPEGSIVSKESCYVPQTGCTAFTNKTVDASGLLSCTPTNCTNPLATRTIPGPIFKGCRRCDDETSSENECKPCEIDEVLTDDFTCKKCSDGKVRNFLAPSQCSCNGITAKGHGIIDGKCTKCPPGSYGKFDYDLGENICVKCPAGTFRREIGLSELTTVINFRYDPGRVCQKCPAGSITEKDGSTECTPCPAGTFSYGVGDRKCLSVGSTTEPVPFDDILPTLPG